MLFRSQKVLFRLTGALFISQVLVFSSKVTITGYSPLSYAIHHLASSPLVAALFVIFFPKLATIGCLLFFANSGFPVSLGVRLYIMPTELIAQVDLIFRA